MKKIWIHHLFISEGHNFRGRHNLGALDFPIVDLLSLDLIAGHGIKGDRFYDPKGENTKRQITFFEHEVYEQVRDQLCEGDLHPSRFRRNVVISDLVFDLLDLVGKEFSIGDALFLGVEEAAPCYWMDEACAPGTHEFLKGKGGLRCKILNDSQIFKGKASLEIM